MAPPLQAWHSAAAPLAMWQAAYRRPANILPAIISQQAAGTPTVPLNKRVTLQPLTAAHVRNDGEVADAVGAEVSHGVTAPHKALAGIHRWVELCKRSCCGGAESGQDQCEREARQMCRW